MIAFSQPRTHPVPKRRRAEKSSLRKLSWIPVVFQTSNATILPKCGLDAFFFLCYLRTLLKMFTFLSLTLIPVLIPLNLIKGKNAADGVRGLDRMSWANVGLTHTKFYWAHLIMALGVITFICHTIYVELLEYIRIRQAYLTSTQRRLQTSSKTILVTDIPRRLLSIDALSRIYSAFPGGVQTVWINRDFSQLSKKIQQRRRVVSTLEDAETKLIKLATSSFQKQSDPMFSKPTMKKLYTADTEGTTPLWKRYLDDKDRDYLRLPILQQSWMPSLPFFGRKVDTISYCSQEIARLNTEINQGQREPEKYPFTSSAFIKFNTQVAAFMAGQSVTHHTPLCLRSQYLEVSPRNIRWDSLSISWWDRYVRTLIAVIAVASLILAWAIPVVFTGLLSQITYLSNLVPWLHWINRIPLWLLGFIQGVLPQLILTIFTILVPSALRTITNHQGLSTYTTVELFLQKYYFTFLFIQVFLTVSLSSSVTTVLKELLHDSESVPAVLARNLPKASNYFFSYILLHGFSVSAAMFIQVGGLVNWIILAPFLDRTPRQIWKRQMNLSQLQWGTILPIYTNLACIGK